MKVVKSSLFFCLFIVGYISAAEVFAADPGTHEKPNIVVWMQRIEDRQALSGFSRLQIPADVFIEEYGMTKREILERLDEFNPAENLSRLAKEKVPMFIIHGDADKVVPSEKISMQIKDAYEKEGGDIVVKIIPDKGHERAPEFMESRDLLEFIIENQ